MKKLILLFYYILLTTIFVFAQDTLYIHKAGKVVYKKAINDLDSLSYSYKPPSTGTLTDIDGNSYHWIQIGTQKWMVENLRTTKFRTGESITNITDATVWSSLNFAAWCDYNNNALNGTKYGRLYNWKAVNDSRKIAPEGWHIPTNAEWSTLEGFLSKSGGSVVKALASVTDWSYSSVNGTIGSDLSANNSSFFNALPGGVRYPDGNYYSIHLEAFFWTSTSYDSTHAMYRNLINNYSSVIGGYYYGVKVSGFSVRCIKD